MLDNYLYSIIKAPLNTEKTNQISENSNTVVLKVLRDATKNDIKSAVEKIFKVEVLKVTTLIMKGKRKATRSLNARSRRVDGFQKNWKKAYVRIKNGMNFEYNA